MRASLSMACATVLVSLLAATSAHAACKRFAFLVNDYGKEGPTNDAKNLLDKNIAEWAAKNGIKDYQVGKKSVSCELFLDVAPGVAQVFAHGVFRRDGVARLNRGDYRAMLLQHFGRSAGLGTGLVAIDTQHIVKIAGQHVGEAFVAAAVDDAVVEIEVLGFLIVSRILLNALLLLVNV